MINLRRAQGPQVSTPRDQGRAARAFYPRLGCCELLHLLNSLGHVRASLISVGLDYKGQDVRRPESLGGATVGTGYSSLLFNVKRQTDFLMQMKSTQVWHHCAKKLPWLFHQKEKVRKHVFYAPSSHCAVFIQWNTEIEARSVCTPAFPCYRNDSHRVCPWLSENPPGHWTLSLACHIRHGGIFECWL